MNRKHIGVSSNMTHFNFYKTIKPKNNKRITTSVIEMDRNKLAIRVIT
jgi:hypothetical protein